MHYNPLKEMRTKVTFLSLLCIVGTFLTTMHAQESCYEQYLQEHDMKILTAEDADDSYDELKKTILAKQMYGDSYVVIADSITQRVKLTKVDGTYIADMHVTLVDSTWYMWLSVDPLAGEYPQISPYSYCMWNPVKYVDPDGRYSMDNIDGDSDYKTIIVLPSEQVLDKMKYKDRSAFLDTYQQARSEKMPIMRIDNAEDYVNAMAALEEMNSSTDSYVLSTSHGYGIRPRLDIGFDNFTAKKGDFSQFRNGLSGKIVFITACRLAANQSGVNLMEDFAKATGSTIIGAEFPVPALLGGFRGGSLSNSPIRNAICNLFGGYCENSFKITNGVNTNIVYGVTIDKNSGIRYNSR